MILTGKKFVEMYQGLGGNPSSLLTSYFKSYVDDTVQDLSFLRKAIITGYLFRCVEEICLEKEIVTKEPFSVITKDVEQILEKNLTKEQKIRMLVDYFDDHDTLGLGEPIRPYTILPYEEAEQHFIFLIEDYIDTSYKGEIENKVSAEDYFEVILRNAAIGYYYRTSEELSVRL